jgi:hypothetical protein
MLCLPQGRNKRDGRQVAAAALMEVLLTRPDDEGGIRAAPGDFLAPSKPTGPSRREVMMKPGVGKPQVYLGVLHLYYWGREVLWDVQCSGRGGGGDLLVKWLSCAVHLPLAARL